MDAVYHIKQDIGARNQKLGPTITTTEHCLSPQHHALVLTEISAWRGDGMTTGETYLMKCYGGY
jgi:hypothetical protein